MVEKSKRPPSGKNKKGETKMEQIFNQAPMARTAVKAKAAETSRPSYQAYQILHVGFTVLPIVMGLDKFLGLLVNWDQYLPAIANRMLGGYGHEFMYVVGVIEVIAGIGVFVKPKIFAYVVAAWLGLIIINLLMIPSYFDIALRDFGLLLGALAFGRLSQEYSK
jgi:hypothetical protein